MTREEAIKIMQLNKGRMNGSVQAALGVLLPELRKEPEHTIDGKEGLMFWLKERITYYDELIPGARKNNPRWYEFYKGRRSGYRTCLELLKRMDNIHIVVGAGKVPMDEIEHQQEQTCFTCYRLAKCPEGKEAIKCGHREHACVYWTSMEEGLKEGQDNG